MFAMKAAAKRSGTQPKSGSGRIWVCHRMKSYPRKSSEYRILTSWTRASGSRELPTVDCWIPELGPSFKLFREYHGKKIDWSGFAKKYREELKSEGAMDLIRSFALLSLRKNLILLCACETDAKCPNQILSAMIGECRRKKDFAMKSWMAGLPQA